MLRFASALPPIALILLPALAAASDYPYTLRQVVDRDDMYFFDDGWDSAFIRPNGFKPGTGDTSVKTVSNIVVRASAGFRGEGFVDAVAGIRSWIDPRGYIHSVSTLRQQQQYNHWLLSHRPDCIQAGCTLTARRGTALLISPVGITGILDASTLRIRQWELEARYDRVASLLEEYCASLAAARCDESADDNAVVALWSKSLSRARQYLNQYDAVLSSVAVRPARSPAQRRLHELDAPNGRSGGGIEDLLVPGHYDSYEYFRAHDAYVVKPTGEEPEMHVEQAVDFRSLATLHQALETARRSAAEDLRSAEHLADAATEVREEMK